MLVKSEKKKNKFPTKAHKKLCKRITGKTIDEILNVDGYSWVDYEFMLGAFLESDQCTPKEYWLTLDLLSVI